MNTSGAQIISFIVTLALTANALTSGNLIVSHAGAFTLGLVIPIIIATTKNRNKRIEDGEEIGWFW